MGLIMKLDFCDICGEEIEGNSCYREDENEHICEECYINWLIERKEKENEKFSRIKKKN